MGNPWHCCTNLKPLNPFLPVLISDPVPRIFFATAPLRTHRPHVWDAERSREQKSPFASPLPQLGEEQIYNIM